MFLTNSEGLFFRKSNKNFGWAKDLGDPCFGVLGYFIYNYSLKGQKKFSHSDGKFFLSFTSKIYFLTLYTKYIHLYKVMESVPLKQNIHRDIITILFSLIFFKKIQLSRKCCSVSVKN